MRIENRFGLSVLLISLAGMVVDRSNELVGAEQPLGQQTEDSEDSRDGQRVLILVGTYTTGPSRGIYLYSMRVDGSDIRSVGVIEGIENPSFLALHPNGRRLYAVAEVVEAEGRPSGYVYAYEIDRKTAEVKFLNRQLSQGGAPCHLVVDHSGENVLVANYVGGNVAVLPLADDGSLRPASQVIQHQGKSVHPRQSEPHAHSIQVDPANRFAIAADLGLDQLKIYQFNSEEGTLATHQPAFVRLAPGAGPRHFAFHPTGRFLYAINELNSTITGFRYLPGEGRLAELQTLPTLPADFQERSTTAEIVAHPSGKFLYGSNRGHDSIAVFRVNSESGELTFVEHESIQGKTPRNFAIDPTGTLLFAAGQGSDQVVVFRIDKETGALDAAGAKFSVPAPVCIRFLPMN